MDHRAYWVWAQNAIGAGSVKIKRILRSYGALQAFYEDKGWEKLRIFTSKEAAVFRSFTIEEALCLIEYCEKLGVGIVTPACKGFPAGLGSLDSPPCVLYVKGTLPDFEKELCVAMVGARKSTASGMRLSERMSYDLAKKGVVIISGGARGIDIAAHKGALRAGGKTLCLLGCGINYPYLLENAETREKISENGALISEYPPHVGVLPGNFPVRNRLIAGLSRGVVVVEASLKSGAMLTVQHALAQGKDVFAVPGDVWNGAGQGTNELIKAGATPVTGAEDILEEYKGVGYAVSAKKPAVAERETVRPSFQKDHFSQDAQAVFRVLGKEPVSLQFLSAKASLPIGQVLAAVTELEIAGALVALPGQQYRQR